MLYSASDNAILHNFLSLSYWQSAVAVIAFYAILIPFFILVTKYKLKFMYRVLIGLGIGLVFGIALQGIIGFPKVITDANDNYISKYEWLGQFNTWAQLMKQIFINGILLGNSLE